MAKHRAPDESPAVPLWEPYPCEQCGQPDEWTVDSYYEDIAEVRLVMGLCRSCAIQNAQDV